MSVGPRPGYGGVFAVMKRRLQRFRSWLFYTDHLYRFSLWLSYYRFSKSKRRQITAVSELRSRIAFELIVFNFHIGPLRWGYRYPETKKSAIRLEYFDAALERVNIPQK